MGGGDRGRGVLVGVEGLEESGGVAGFLRWGLVGLREEMVLSGMGSSLRLEWMLEDFWLRFMGGNGIEYYW